MDAAANATGRPATVMATVMAKSRWVTCENVPVSRATCASVGDDAAASVGAKAKWTATEMDATISENRMVQSSRREQEVPQEAPDGAATGDGAAATAAGAAGAGRALAAAAAPSAASLSCSLAVRRAAWKSSPMRAATAVAARSGETGRPRSAVRAVVAMARSTVQQSRTDVTAATNAGVPVTGNEARSRA
jgi:hypothetical protein